MTPTITALLFSLWVSAPSVDTAISRARAAEASGDFAAAAANYKWAAAHDAQLSKFLRYRALRALLQSEDANPDEVDALAAHAAQWGYAGSALAATLADARRRGGLPGVELLQVTLDSEDHDDVCALLTERIAGHLGEGHEVPAELVDVHHGECSDATIASFAEATGHTPSNEARVRRADRLHGQVRFIAAAEELSKLGDLAKLEPESLRCRAWFRKGRVMYRLRKRRAESEPAFAKVADQCNGDGERSLRRRALYAVGKRRFELDDLPTAKTRFETLLADFPDASHADDAVFYLARVARGQKDRKRELELLDIAAAKYPDGDMFGEIVWEVLEQHYRAGDWQKFVDAVDAVKRPDHDGMYYSQGRLEYFTGQALMKLNKKAEGKERWKQAWSKYPWSFYGYLSRMRLGKLGELPPDPEAAPDGKAPWLDARSWHAGPLGRLTTHDVGFASEFAAAFEAADDEQRWQLAWVYDRAGQYHVSHNIVRRAIGGRPWLDPLPARRLQWELAWPDPFGPQVEEAVAAENTQAGKGPQVRPALPRSIMREESSFIEDIESYAGALGLMQLMPRTALGHDDDVNGPATPERLKTAAVNIRVGADHIFWLARRFDGHPALMVAAYNAGSGRIEKWMKEFGNDDIALFVEDIPSLQTRGYTKRVIGSYAAYQWLRHPEQPLDDRILGAAK